MVTTVCPVRFREQNTLFLDAAQLAFGPGAKFFVAVDRTFFTALPQFRKADSFENSEITWLVYPFSRKTDHESYTMGIPEIVYSEWAEVEFALREGTPPAPQEILEEIQKRRNNLQLIVPPSKQSG